MVGNMIIVTGLHRSGTTFMGELIARATSAAVINEPLNVGEGIKEAKNWYYNEDNLFTSFEQYRSSLRSLNLKYKPPIIWTRKHVYKHLIGSRSRLLLRYARLLRLMNRDMQILVKDPFCLFLANQFLSHGDKVVVCTKEPSKYIASLKKQQWYFNFEEFAQHMQLQNTEAFAPHGIISQNKINTLEDNAAKLWYLAFDFLLTVNAKNALFINVERLDIPEYRYLKFLQLSEYLGVKTNTIDRSYESVTKNGLIWSNRKIHDFKREFKKDIQINRTDNLLKCEELWSEYYAYFN